MVGISDLYIFGGMNIKVDDPTKTNLSKKTYCYSLLNLQNDYQSIYDNKSEMKNPVFSITSCVVGNSLIFSIGLLRKIQENETSCEMYDIRKDRWSIQKSPTHHSNIIYLICLDNRYIYAACKNKMMVILDTTDIEQGWNHINVNFGLGCVNLVVQVSQNEIMLFSWEDKESGTLDIRTRKFRGPHFGEPNYTRCLSAGGCLIPYIHSADCPMRMFLSYNNLNEAKKINDTPCYISNHNLSRSDIDIEANIDELNENEGVNIIFNIPPEVKRKDEQENNCIILNINNNFEMKI